MTSVALNRFAEATAQTARPTLAKRGKIGPNAIIQLGETLRSQFGWATAFEFFAAAGISHMLDSPPQQMTDEAIPAHLYAALWRAFPQSAPALAKEAGMRTADYVIANRIPKFVQVLLGLCPKPLAARLLLKAIKKNAWTFVGSGQCTTRYGTPCLIDVADNPLAMPDCVWHSAVFQRMFDRLVTPGTLVTHRSIGSNDAPVCRFEIRFPNAETKHQS